MKNFLSKMKTTIVFFVVTVLTLVLYLYMIARPISYGMEYHTEYTYDGVLFEGTMEFKLNGVLVNSNSNFNEPIISRYYYKDGYIFFTMAKTDEEYNKEVEWIESNFEEAVNTMFYASKVNAFKLVNINNDLKSEYKCTSAVVFAVVAGVFEFTLASTTCISFIFYKKTKEKE